MARARRAASICAVRDSSLCMRSISLFTRSTRRRTPACAAGGARLCPENLLLSAPLFRAPHGDFRAPGALPIAHLAQTLAQSLEAIKRGVIDFRMVSAQDDLMLVIAENAALEFTGYGHGGPLVSCAAANEHWYYNVHSRRINTVASEPWWQDVPWLSLRNRPGGIHQ